VKYDVIVVGAGASGLMAAILAARQGSSVLVIERKEKAGKKILATGNGKCNFTNLVQTPECYRSDDSAFAMKVLSCFDVKKTLDFFEELGIYPKERGGYLYPNSEQAASVVQVLMMECVRQKVEFHYEESVIDIIKPYFTVITEQNSTIEDEKKTNSNRNKPNKYKVVSAKHTYQGKNLILAAGGCASPQLGSDGSGYQLAKKLGHTIIKPLPALVQLKSPDKFKKTVSGVRTIAAISVYADQKQIAAEEGEILFTDYGISGIPIMQVSRFVAKALDKGALVQLLIDFLPAIRKETVKTLILKRLKLNPNKSLEEMMIGLLNHKLSYLFIKEAGLDSGKEASFITEKEIDALVKQIKSFRMTITDTNSFENAQVCAGGVSTKEIEVTTMESKLVKRLFVTGELLDVDGTCGGYNLQWAWSSGYLAGAAAGNKE